MMSRYCVRIGEKARSHLVRYRISDLPLVVCGHNGRIGFGLL